MTRAFIVKYNISGNTDLPQLAEDIHADLLSAGHDIVSVVPFKEKALQAPTQPISPKL